MAMSRLGMSLVEVMVASALVAMSVVAGIGAGEYYTRSSVTQSQDEAFLRMSRGVELILTRQSSCDANLAGLMFVSGALQLAELSLSGPGSANNTSSSPFVKVYSSSPANAFPLGVGSSSRALWVADLKLQELGSMAIGGSGSVGRYQLLLSAEAPHGPGYLKPLGPAKRTRVYELLLEVDANQKVLRCVLPGPGVAASADPQALCTAMGGDWVSASNGGGGSGGGGTSVDYCDIRRKTCHAWNTRFDGGANNGTGGCNFSDLRKAALVGPLGEGPCGSQNYLQVISGVPQPIVPGADYKRVLGAFERDGEPSCGDFFGATMPSLPTPALAPDVLSLSSAGPGAFVCGDCWEDSPADCWRLGPGGNYQKGNRFKIYRRGLFYQSVCTAFSAPMAISQRCKPRNNAQDPWTRERLQQYRCAP